MTDHRLWPATDGPGSHSVDTPVWLAVEFYATQTASLTAFHFWRATTSITGTQRHHLWQVDSPSSGTAVPGTDGTFDGVSGTGWQTQTLGAPVSLTVDQRYRAAIYFPTNYSATGGYWAPGGAGQNGITNGPLTAPNATDALGTDQGSFAYSGTSDPVFPTGSFNGGNYWVDVTITADDQDVRSPVIQVVNRAALIRAAYY